MQKARIMELVLAAVKLIDEDGHHPGCNFEGCNCGRTEGYKAARSEILRLVRKLEENPIT